MNLLDATVTKVLSRPKQYAFSKERWFVEVEYECWGRVSNGEIMKNSLEEALLVKPGYKFLT